MLIWCRIKCMYAETLGCMYADFGCMYMETFGCKYADFGCKYMEQLGACMRVLGAKYAVVGCKVCGCWVHICGNSWVHVCGCWVHLWQRLIACLTVGSLPDSRWLHSPRVSCSLGPGAPGPNNQNNQTIKQSNNQAIKQSNNQTIQ